MKQISWLNGQWGSNTQLKLPLSDRGLNLGDGIFETILILKGTPTLLTEHLNRWQRSASLLCMATPPDKEWLLPLIQEALSRAELNEANGVLRLNWTRGDYLNRQINIDLKESTSNNHRFWLEINEKEPCFTPVTSMISQHERRNHLSRLSQCKTFTYLQAIQAKNEANSSNRDEALLLSTNGEISCGSTSNLIIYRNNQWLTPRLESGCLPGIMRAQGIKSGLIKEARINAKPEPGDNWMLINSLNCRPISKLNNHSLEIYTKAKYLWYSLLK